MPPITHESNESCIYSVLVKLKYLRIEDPKTTSIFYRFEVKKYSLLNCRKQLFPSQLGRKIIRGIGRDGGLDRFKTAIEKNSFSPSSEQTSI